MSEVNKISNTSIPDTYIDDVTNEINNIKQYVPLVNRKYLDIDRLNPNHTSKCIYGLMYLYCYSGEAEDAIRKCCKAQYSFSQPVYDSALKSYPARDRSLFSNSFSCLEHYIVAFPSQNKDIISYIKDELDELPELTMEILIK